MYVILYISLGEGGPRVYNGPLLVGFPKEPWKGPTCQRIYAILYVSLGVVTIVNAPPPSWSVFLKIPGRVNELYGILYSRGRFQEYATPPLGPFS